ncbi:endo-1,4-beta-xylanase [Myceligenerans salitolerans]|uniref:Beta-xylanase n=1 Tax=Myceligenerans salitolerans TaxID=1230528 RepID=A0ABS3IF29_9MICO|nr:endo-1,4-beta-xylanase [Myceligenerans salitolerans]MBO0611251.1 endo-1,4-beta-xylanase [Myceligenerans salitolerans]
MTAAATAAALALTGTAAALAMTSPAAAAPVTITEADFTDGTTGAWTASGSATLNVVPDPDDAGNNVLSITRAADYEGIQSPTGIFEAGATYDFSMRARIAPAADGETQPASTGVRFVMKPDYDWIGNTTITSEWTTVTGSFTAAADADPTALQAYLGTTDQDGPYTIMVDDILVTSEDSGNDPGTAPGGAINPVPTPAYLADGTGDVSALTFDDGPNPGTTPALLDFLAEHDLSAVFCVIGQNVQADGGAEILRRIVDEGHVLCNHSTGYADMGGWSADEVRADMVENLRIIRQALGNPNQKVPFWRAPNGSWGVTPDVAVELGMQPLDVRNTIADWETQDEAVLTENLRAAMVPGELVLAHDGGGDRSGTLAAVRTVVTERLADGWEFVFPQGTPPASGTVLTTDFEDGTLGGWGPRNGADGSGFDVAVTDAYAHESTYSAGITNRENTGDGIGLDVTEALRAGVTYDVSAWVRFAEGATPGDVWLSLAHTSGGETTYDTVAQFDGMSSSSWREVTATFTMPAADDALLYLETAYNGENLSDWYVDDIEISVPEPPVVEDLTPIHETTDFPVGVAIDARETTGPAAELTTRHFDQLTPENHMKPEAWYDDEGNFRRHSEATALMDFAAANDLNVYGHVLVWHSQTPEWFFQDDAGDPLPADAAGQEILRERLRTHIFAVAEDLAADYGPFGSDTNPLVAWDVVNEVISDSGEYDDGMRRSEWYRILGEDFVDLAFRYADEAFNETYAAPPSDTVPERPVTLFINDYNTEQSGKQDRYLALTERLLARGVPVDGVGHQFHVNLSMPVGALETALDRFADLPVTQAVTELDVTTGTPVTQAALIEQGYYYRDAFRAFRERSGDLYSATVWGLTDGRSWRVDSGAPLVFDDAYQAKPAYHGVVDGELPAKLRTADVFAGDVPLDDDATGSLEWDKLPLHTFAAADGNAAFQLRWAPDHLTAYVSVDDTTASDDAVTLTLGETGYTIARDGSGDADAVVSERDGGYDVVVRLPLEAAAEGDTLGLDVRVSDGGEDAGAWNSPGALGTLTLVEELSYTRIPGTATAPVIDGAADAAYDAAEPVVTAKSVEGEDGAEATVSTTWHGSTLYVLAEVADPAIDVSGSDPWIQDSVEIYVDAGNAKNGGYRADDTQIRISAENVVSFGTGDEADQAARLTSAVRQVEGGYVVEAAVDLLEYGGVGTFHGLDFQVNDATDGARTAIRNWADPTGAGYQSTAHWGVGRLVEAPGIRNTEPPEITGTARPGKTLTAEPGEWSVDDVTFTYQWLRDGEPMAGHPHPKHSGTGKTYKVKPWDAGHELTVEVTAEAEGYDPVAVTSEPVTVRHPSPWQWVWGWLAPFWHWPWR